jgi:hypothetical protein
VIFCAKNEDGVPTWKLVLEGKKTITRRLKPMSIGKEFAIQPGRGKKAVARGKVIDCWNSKVHEDYFFIGLEYITQKKKVEADRLAYCDVEAALEGFKTWQGLRNWFFKHKININDTYRIEFKLIKER